MDDFDSVFDDFDTAMSCSSADELTDGIEQCFALSTAFMALGLRGVIHAEAEGLAETDGARNTADWLSQRIGIPLGTAHRYLKVAERLAVLPRLAAAMFGGEFCFDQVSQICRFATPDTEAGVWPAWSTQLADALVMACRQHFATKSQASRPHLVVHVDAGQLKAATTGAGGEVAGSCGVPGVGHFELGPAISPEMVRRLACDSTIQLDLHDTTGATTARSNSSAPAAT